MRHPWSHRVTLCLIAVAVASVRVAAGGPAAATVSSVTSALGKTEWTHVSTRDYEETQPGLGYSRRFESGAGWADVFVYDGNYRGWLDGVDDPNLRPVFDALVGDVVKVAGPGTGCRLISKGTVNISGRPYLHAALQLQVKGREMESHVYLTAVDHRLVKFRISLYAPVAPAERASMESFIAEQLAFVLKNPVPQKTAFAPLRREIAISLSSGGLDDATGKVWLCYALARADFLTHSGHALPPVGVVEAGFDEELTARRTALDAYREFKARQPTLRSTYWDALDRVEHAGFLPEYVWVYHHHASWAARSTPRHLVQFNAWRREHLAGHEPETRSGVFVQGIPVAR